MFGARTSGMFGARTKAFRARMKALVQSHESFFRARTRLARARVTWRTKPPARPHEPPRATARNPSRDTSRAWPLGKTLLLTKEVPREEPLLARQIRMHPSCSGIHISWRCSALAPKRAMIHAHTCISHSQPRISLSWCLRLIKEIWCLRLISLRVPEVRCCTYHET